MNMLALESEKNLKELCAIYSQENGKICVFTGAGVSFIKTEEYKTPGWWGLLRDVYTSLSGYSEMKRKYSSFRKLQMDYPDPWEMAGYFESIIHDEDQLNMTFCRILNRRVTKDTVYKRLPHPYLNNAKTLNATIAFCSQIRAKRQYHCLRHNQRIQAVITLNYDCFLEAGATTKYQSAPFKPFSSKESAEVKSKLPVYHIHGYAPYGYHFEVTPESLEVIRQKGVPEDILGSLETLINQPPVAAREFLKKLKKSMEKSPVNISNSCRQTILDLTRVERRPYQLVVMTPTSYKMAYNEEDEKENEGFAASTHNEEKRKKGFAARILGKYLGAFSTLFIGVSFSDKLLLKKLRSIDSRNPCRHFALVMQKDSEKIKKRLSGTNVAPIVYKTHEYVPIILERIYKAALEPAIPIPQENKHGKFSHFERISSDTYWNELLKNKR